MVLPQFQPGLLFDALESAYWQIPLWMRNGDRARFVRMLELNVAALCGDLVPTILAQYCNNVAAPHGQIIHTRVYSSK